MRARQLGLQSADKTLRTTDNGINIGWSEAEDQLLREQWGSMSSGVISANLREKFQTTRSRNAIIGRAHRLKLGLVANPRKLVLQPRVPKARIAKTPRQRQRVKPREHQRFTLLPTKSGPIPPTFFPEPVVEVKPLNLPIWELERHHCRFITGKDDKDLSTYCGHTAHGETSWCKSHYHVVYQPKQPVSVMRKYGAV